MRTRTTGSRRTGRRLTAAFGVAAVLTTAACGGDSDSSGSGGSQSGDASLALAINAQPATLDPAQLAEGQQAYLWTSIYDTLLTLDNEGQLQPNAAESWEYSADGRTLTLKLRDGMTFSSGDPVTAEAVRATLERTRTTPGQQQGKLAAVESVEAPDDSTVVLNLSEPDSSLLVNLAQAAGVIGDPATIENEDSVLDPVGSGPYVLDDEATVPGSTYVLERRDDHWNVDAYPFETVTVRVIQDRTAVFNALQTGELNAGTVEAPQGEQLASQGFDIAKVDATAVGNLVLADRSGTVQPAFADPRVRQAINMAFDREKIVEQLLQGNGLATQQIFNPKGEAYVEELNDTYEYDPEGAKALLAEAGYANGFEITMPSTIISQNFEPTITQALADIGIRVTWEPVPPQNTASAVASGTYPAVFFIDGLNAAPRELANNFAPDGFLNPFDSELPAELTELMDQIATETDPTAAGDLLQQANEVIVENALTAPLFYAGTTWATTDGIEYLGDGSNTLNTVRAFGVSA
ncbi:ABC transporter substrate-binding protein [Modestobacter roseus]|uniref:Peptide/nickel transport system substrate-binding protein n=1 Tax=Modestobacter roseus TaxID=1181884 RepID=A0A562IMF1_9ACTN|nr:ABC transporter substrate-binding protein [Modestobacter roseus]MQA33765.1 ABC transporter substrate-binding protein [Modestobacter roseus]TWH72052.1 peptide/nickel transport system substrate-binding protein [Modestobacter roseus]